MYMHVYYARVYNVHVPVQNVHVHGDHLLESVDNINKDYCVIIMIIILN